MTTLVHDTPQHSRLMLLPRELVDNIAAWLPTQDFNALRLTCKDLEAKSFKYWSECFFKKRQFMIDQFSLQTLVDISQHAALSQVMTHLVIGLDELQACHRRPSVGSFAEFSRWRDAYCAQKALLYGGGAADILSTALSNLPRLHTIDIRDFESSTRYRDVVAGREVPRWRSYGSSRYQQWPRETPWLVGLSGPRTNFVDTVFTVVLAAVARSSSAVRNLEVILRNRKICLQDDAFSTFWIPGTLLTNGLPALTKLHLDLDARGLTGSGFPANFLNMSNHAWLDPSTEYLRRFLALTPNVSWLRLNFPLHDELVSSPGSKLMAWLSLRSDFNAPPDAPWGQGNPVPVALPLRRLDLGNVTISLVIIRGLLMKFADLEHIVMRDVRLYFTASTPDQDEDEDRTSCEWSRLIRSLNVTGPKLKKLELDRVTEGPPGNLIPIIFLDKHNQKEFSFSTSIKIDDTSTDELADRIWTMMRWTKAYAQQDSEDEGEDDDVMDEQFGDSEDEDEDEGTE
ncbi:hypothetical protein KVR01_006518 [Diaporthe batatas]|uniref:uncharacterized protein n=1 Tax=Diaporthe batatas TaxID=748121 RepID=UPI001D04FB81|nr:uncharacterized protein KVR01_006518 [Diaporthe batatas]KAG8163221.1 hypothetical protein KVR01_006518 [Diaporthe batatas]